MNELQALRWIMEQPFLMLNKNGDDLTIYLPSFNVKGQSLIECVLNAKGIIERLEADND